jgi:Gpi18-like mannosyltransferase
LAPSFAYLLAIGYLFNPAILVNSTFWGQVDSFFTLLIVLAIVMITEKRIYASAVIFTAAVLMKPQAIIILPILFFELIRLKQVKHFFGIAFTAAFTAAVILLPFSAGKSPTWIINLFSSTIGEYPYASVNAYNFFSLIGANYKDSSATLLFFSYHTWGLIFIVATTVFSWLIYIKGCSFKYAALAALIQISGVFTFSSSMHERYLFPAAALALLAYIYLKDKNLLYLSLGFSISIFMNTFFVLYGDSNMQNSTSYPFSMFATSMLNVLLVIYLVKVAWNLVQKSTVLKTA